MDISLLLNECKNFLYKVYISRKINKDWEKKNIYIFVDLN